jgi:cobyrinic acid a,c-diamide synthase
MNRVLISAAHKSSGKTTVSIGLCAALKQRGISVQPFKKGPDYIDPMWLSQACGRGCRNLDFYMMDHEEVTTSFIRNSSEFNLVEGNKGLYDGLALDGSNSNAALAKTLDLPVVLVIDARGMTRGIAPLILGYQAFDKEINIAGVILNNLGGSRHESKLREVIAHYTDVPVIGAIQHDDRLSIIERHLGLMPSNESQETVAKIKTLGDAIESQVELDKLIVLSSRPPLISPLSTAKRTTYPADSKVKIGIAQDRAFGFYYADDLDALTAAGAEIVPFDTTRDKHLPQIDGLFIGGGFPEIFAAELEANSTMRSDIKNAIDTGMPVYAECGGLMYLSRQITYKGSTHTMVGAIPGDVFMHNRPVGRGYVQLSENTPHPWPQNTLQLENIKAHEFHYSSLENLPTDAQFAYRVVRGHGIDGQHDGYLKNNLLACYAHLRSVNSNPWAERFVSFIRKLKQTNKKIELHSSY